MFTASPSAKRAGTSLFSGISWDMFVRGQSDTMAVSTFLEIPHIRKLFAVLVFLMAY